MNSRRNTSVTWVEATFRTLCGCGKQIKVGDKLGAVKGDEINGYTVWSCEPCTERRIALIEGSARR